MAMRVFDEFLVVLAVLIADAGLVGRDEVFELVGVFAGFERIAAGTGFPCIGLWPVRLRSILAADFGFFFWVSY